MKHARNKINRIKLNTLTDKELKEFLNGKSKSYVDSLCMVLVKNLCAIGDEYDFYIEEISMDKLLKGEIE